MIDLLAKYFSLADNKKKLRVGILKLDEVYEKLGQIDFCDTKYLQMIFEVITPGVYQTVDINVYHLGGYNFLIGDKEVTGLEDLIESIREEVKKESDEIINERKQEQEVFKTLDNILRGMEND
ncbi:hypothetical protein HOS99_gp058 [Staphylococcus phage phiSA_BS1]|uniref:Uncharacterized protein n=1 Tax=Staphylococcus phage phiSA_BS1 TaxID=2126734 RepID=A0A2P1MXM8_9CAUD|nr:hypothetical protein HOS99_gp058 [Staphylococcus phage phiSA_BS1]AVP40308.1 hypothetical protein [Staphylococcus phage phiSA_BS1]